MAPSMKKVLCLFLSVITLGTTLRLTMEPETPNKDPKMRTPIRISMVTFPNVHTARPRATLYKENSNFETLLAAELWQNRQEHHVDVMLNEDGMSWEVPELSVKASGKSWFPWDKFLTEFAKDLPLQTLDKLSSCRFSGETVGHLDKAEKAEKKMKGPDIYLIFFAETVPGEALAKHAPARSVLVGNGYNSTHLDHYFDDGRKVHSVFLPYGTFWNFESEQHPHPLELMTRSDTKNGLHQKSDDLTVVYQQSKCYAGREEWWDDLCQGMKDIGKTCFFMGNCNGNKKLGVQPSFPSAGARGDAHWQDAAIKNYAKFKFVSGLEHTENSFGYVTEKLFLPLMAGTIPIYTGDKHALDHLGVNPKSYIYVTQDNHKQVINEVQNLLANESEYRERLMQPVIKEESFKKYFTLHSSTWKKYGDGARQKIVSAILDVC